jgi:glycosyltransferase involved in cell wall biosynthesis
MAVRFRLVKIGISLLSQQDSQFTGTSRYVSELMHEMASLEGRAKLEVLCNERAMAQAASWAAPNVTVKKASGFKLGSSRYSRVAAIASGLARSGPLARQFSADVEAVQYPLIIPLPRVRLPTLVNHYDLLHRDHPELFSRAELWWRSVAYDWFARRATLILTPSEHSRTKIVEHLGVNRDRVIAIPLAVDRRRFRPEPERNEDQQLARLRLPDRFLFYPASLWPHKNHRRLLAAFARLEDCDLQLLLSGASLGHLRDLLVEAERLGLRERVRHLGFIAEEDLAGVYRRATALAFPSRYEGFGTPPLEAMACGCPVASSGATSLVEVCGDAALELDPENVEQMSAALDRISKDEQLRADLKRKGLKQAARFSWRRTAEAHLDAYRLALAIGRS